MVMGKLFKKVEPEPVVPNDQELLGLLRMKVLKGTNLAIRDLRSSDPYVIVLMGKQKLKTHVVKRNVNPVWNEELTLSIVDPTHPIRIEVYDKDTFSFDDPMGNAEIDIQPFIEAVRLNLTTITNKTIIRKLVPNRQNCLAEESPIYFCDGKILQDIILRLKNVESGEVEMQLQWVNVPCPRA